MHYHHNLNKAIVSNTIKLEFLMLLILYECLGDKMLRIKSNRLILASLPTPAETHLGGCFSIINILFLLSNILGNAGFRKVVDQTEKPL